MTVPRGQSRKDARRNREAILDAARELFAESADVAMCEVARRAGVGQATLYRNFPDRRALAAEILGEHVERIARLAAEHDGDPDAFFVLLRSLVEGMVHLYAVSELAREDACVGSQLERDRQRVAQLLKRPLCGEGRRRVAARHVARRRVSRAADGQRRDGESAWSGGPCRRGEPGAHACARWDRAAERARVRRASPERAATKSSRMVVAQAAIEQAVVISNDQRLLPYGVALVW